MTVEFKVGKPTKTLYFDLKESAHGVHLLAHGGDEFNTVLLAVTPNGIRRIGNCGNLQDYIDLDRSNKVALNE